MADPSTDLPLRGGRIETRPLYVEEWLDSLPYVDFRKTARLLCEATRATNEQPLKAQNRLELVELYHRPYQYYVESQIRTGAQHTLQSIETMQAQVELLKQIAVNLAVACRRATDEALTQKTLWRQSKPPLPAMLSSLTYLGHALIFSFLEYAPAPKNVWREIHATFSLAEQLGKAGETVLPAFSKSARDATTIAHAYKRIVMAALADPHHLPFGAIWEIYEQLGDWSRHVDIVPFDASSPPGGQFVVNLDSDARPLALAKFRIGEGGDRHRLVDARAVGGLVEEQLERLASGQGLGEGMRLSPLFARAVLTHLRRAWGLPPKRSSPRGARQGSLQLVPGLSAVYYFLNGQKEFERPVNGDEEDAFAEASGNGVHYTLDRWELVDEGPGGLAVIKSERPRYAIRVGELLGIGTEDDARLWRLGVVRWMMVRQGQGYRIGVQLLSAAARPVAVRAVTGSSQDCRYRRALLLEGATGSGAPSLVTDRGLFLDGRVLELWQDGSSARVTCGTLVESAVGFDHFEINGPRG